MALTSKIEKRDNDRHRFNNAPINQRDSWNNGNSRGAFGRVETRNDQGPGYQGRAETWGEARDRNYNARDYNNRRDYGNAIDNRRNYGTTRDNRIDYGNARDNRRDYGNARDNRRDYGTTRDLGHFGQNDRND